MESFLALFIFQDSYVVSLLVLAIAVVIVLLLVFNHKNPETIVQTEITDQDPIEGALRRVLGEQRWLQNTAQPHHSDQSDVDAEKLEVEILEKDRVIAELNKKLTQGQSHLSASSSGDDHDLLSKIAELQSRLQEYEIIEDDIADLSLYRSENEKLKEEINRLKAMVGGATKAYQAPQHNIKMTTSSIDPIEDNRSFTVKDSSSSSESSFEPIRISGSNSSDGGSDLISQFQKVVDQQEKITSPQGSVTVTGRGDTGKVIIPDRQKKSLTVEHTEEVHPKLKGIPPDSKEEAEIFITELKSLKKVQ